MRFVQLSTTQDIELLMDRLPSEFSIDTEYRHADPEGWGVPDSRKAILTSIVISTDGEVGYSIPASFVDLLQPIKKAKCLYLQNFRADYEILGRHGLDLTNTPFRDSMLLHHLIDENLEHNLGFMVNQYFSDNYKEEFWAKYKSVEEAPTSEALEYEGKDVIYTYKLVKTFLGYLHDKEQLIDLVHRVALALYFTERDGIRIDYPLMLETKQTMGAEIEGLIPAMRAEFLPQCQAWEMEQWLKKQALLKTARGKANVIKPSFNFGSDKQVSWLVYDELKMPVLKRTKRTPKGGGNNPSVDYEALEMLEKEGHYLGSLKAYKEIKNLYGTFVEGLIERVEDGRIYPEFSVNGTATGRLSHSNPNMGNMPKDGPFRNFFLPERHHSIFGADYEQLEIIIEANLTGDKNTISIIQDGASKHDITAQNLKIAREDAKTVNFAMGYRCSPFRLQKILKCSAAEAELLWNKYWETYSGVRELQKYCDKRIADGLAIVTPFGRERHFAQEFENEKDRARAQRQGYNALIQGTGGDCMNLSFAMASERMRKSGTGRMLWSVHDEGVGACKTAEVENEKLLLVKDMESLSSFLEFKLPLKAKPYGALERWAKA